MPNSVIDGALRDRVRRWLMTSDLSWRALPTPDDSPVQTVEGIDPDRLLLIGSGIAVGYGTRRHEDALAGRLARLIAAATGRGARIDIVTEADMSAERMTTLLDRARLAGLDAVIATPGGFESLLFMSRAAWRRQLRTLLDHVAQHGPASLEVLFVAVPPMTTILELPPIIARAADQAVARLNDELERACAGHPQAHFIPFVPTERATIETAGERYEEWAGLIAPHVVERLDAQAAASR